MTGPNRLLSQLAPTGNEAEETLHAIVLGDADALVIEGPDGPRVYTLKDASEPYRHLVERMSEAAVVLDRNATILYCNGRLPAITGRGGLAGSSFLDLVAGDQQSRAERLLAAGLEFSTTAEMTLLSVDGTGVPVRVAAAPMTFDNEPCLALVVTVLDDIVALKAAKAGIEDVLASIDDGFYAVDAQWRFIYMNKRAQDALDLGDTAFLGKDYLAVCPWMDGHEIHSQLRQAMADRQPFHFEAFGPVTKSWMSFSAYPASHGGLSVCFRNIQPRKEAELALKAAKAEAERAVLARSKFLAAASHDLRQPVQSLTLLMAVLKPHVTAPQVIRAVGVMESALEGLNGLLTSILDVSRLDAGVVMPQMASVDIGALLGRLSEEYALLAGRKGLRLKAVRSNWKARTDPVLLERALRNLVENAIRYTEAGGILLGARRRGDRVRIDVVDSGIGIPADKQPHIFEEFYQVGNAARNSNEGLGLGLAIVGRLARLLGAELRVSSRDGRGSCFSLCLPLDHTPSQMVPIPPVAGAPSARILIIEDDISVRFGLQLLAESWGHRVVLASSGEEALALGVGEDWQFELIMADHRLGLGLDGTGTAKEIRARAGWPVPTLVITGDTAPERIYEIHASGFDIMHKPVAAEELRLKVAQLLRSGADSLRDRGE